MKPITLSPEEFANLKNIEPSYEDDSNVSSDFPFLKALVASKSKESPAIFSAKACVPGEIVLRENELGDNLFIIWSGRIAIVKGSFQNPTLLGFRGSGDIIGEMALLENRPRSASAIALEPTELLGTDREGFQRLLNEPPFVGINLLEMLSARLRASDESRAARAEIQRQLVQQLSVLESEKSHLLEMQRIRQETTDLIVHDLRNPLGTIYVALKTLELDLPENAPEHSLEFLQIAISSCERLQRLVESMLEVSRMEEGELSLIKSKVDLSLMLTDYLKNLEKLHSSRFQFTLQIQPDLPPIIMDREKIERVLANLLDNALKHSPPGGAITIQAASASGLVYVSVNDEGPGIPPAEHQRIFERFTQVAGEKRKRRGFGLGLNYCKLAIEAHGGAIWVEPGQSGQGSRFVFTLPLS